MDINLSERTRKLSPRKAGDRAARLACAGAAALACAGLPALTRADFWTWNNATDTWSNPAAWTPQAVPAPGPGTALSFGGSGTTGYVSTNDLPGTFVLNQLTLTNASTAGGTNAVTLAGSALAFGGTAPQILQAAGGDVYVNAPVVFDAAAVTVAGSGTGVVTLNGAVTGGAGLVKNGPGALRFGSVVDTDASDNTWYGGLTINDGSFRFNNGGVTGRSALRSNRVTLNALTAVLSSSGELRTGEINGPAGTVLARDTTASADAHDLLIQTLGSATFGGTINLLPTGTNTTEGKINIRGPGSQTLSGTLTVNNDITVGWRTTVTLAGTASLASTTGGQIVLHGGTFTLDNSTGAVNRLRDESAAVAVEPVGGGTFNLVGPAAGMTETTGILELGNVGTTADPRSGGLTVAVTHRAGTAAATVMNFAGGYERYGTANSRATVDFAARDGNGTALALGQAGNAPRVLLANAGSHLFGGLLSRTDATPASNSSNVGWATVNGADFASYNATTGVVPVVPVAFPASGSATTNALLTGTGAITASTAFLLNSLKIAPSAAGQSLQITGTGALSTNAILLAGSTDYAIVNSGTGTAGLSGPGGARYFQVPSAVLTVGVPITGSNPIVKAGDGVLALTGSNSGVKPTLTINGGAVRASLTSLPSGIIEFRGGVLELTGGGTFSAPISAQTSFRNVNWRGDGGGTFGLSNQNKGSGGFAAVGSPVSIDLGAAGPTDLIWEDPYFLDSAHALILNSPRATSTVTWTDNLALSAFAALPAEYAMREIHVPDNPAAAADFGRVTGTLSGLVQNDLLKTGAGTLELAAANTYAGGTIVAEGTLLLKDPAALGAGAGGAYVLVGMRGGSNAAALQTGHTAGLMTIARDVNVQAGGTGAVTLGNAVAPDAATAGDATFAGRVTLGSTGASAGRLLRLSAVAGTTVRFAGGIVNVPGYTGAMDLEKTGGGTAVVATALGHTGATTVSAGTLSLETSLTTSASLTVIGSGSVARLASGGSRVIDTTAVTLSAGGVLDLTNNALVVDYAAAGPTPFSTLLGYLKGGTLTSSLKSADTDLGLVEASALYHLTGAQTATFAGQTVDASAVLARYVLKGDADLDGTVGLNDLVKLANHYGLPTSAGWIDGDFDYSGDIGLNDLVILANHYGAALPAAPVGDGAFQADLALAFELAAAGRSAVPEPGALGLAGAAGAIGLLVPRRRRPTRHGCGGSITRWSERPGR